MVAASRRQQNLPTVSPQPPANMPGPVAPSTGTATGESEPTDLPLNPEADEAADSLLEEETGVWPNEEVTFQAEFDVEDNLSRYANCWTFNTYRLDVTVFYPLPEFPVYTIE